MPSVEALTKIALIYGVSLDYLVGVEKNRTTLIEGLTNRQFDILNTLLIGFKSK